VVLSWAVNRRPKLALVAVAVSEANGARVRNLSRLLANDNTIHGRGSTKCIHYVYIYEVATARVILLLAIRANQLDGQHSTYG
jgi:hypothetical protein